MQPQGEVTNVVFCEAIKVLSQALTNQVGQQRQAHWEGNVTLKIWKFLRITGSSTTKDLENCTEELNKVFKVIHVADTERVELTAYQRKGIARNWFD